MKVRNIIMVANCLDALKAETSNFVVIPSLH